FQGLVYMQQKSAILFVHRDQEVYFYNYDPTLQTTLGAESGKFNSVFHLFSEEDRQIINQYIKVINSYALERRDKKDRLSYFTIIGNNSLTDYDHGYALKIYPQVYNRDGCLVSTICILETISYIGKPILRHEKIIENQSFIYSRVYKRFVKEEKQDLSPTDLKIIRLTGEGKKEQEIADELGVTLANLKRQKAALMDKIDVKTLSEAIFYAYKKGLI
ncbi:MAG: response regulator transcription factor, partial [Tannerellaceae bacterium]